MADEVNKDNSVEKETASGTTPSKSLTTLSRAKDVAKKYWWVAAVVVPFGSIPLIIHFIKKMKKKK